MTLLQAYERWLPVVGWEGWYEVSDRGRVRSLDRIIQDRNGISKRLTGKILKLQFHRFGYPQVSLYRDGVGKCVLVHVLVLEAFDRPCPPGMECLHGPGGPADNRWPEAIRWGTHPENCQDMLRDGTGPQGERHGQAKLTEAIVRECRRRRKAGETLPTLAFEFEVDRSVMGRAIRGVTWAHVPFP